MTLPGMLHARMVRPPTIGSTLITVGEVDKKRFPTAEVVRKGNLVAVVSPNEWEGLPRCGQSPQPPSGVAGPDFRAARTSPRRCAHIRGALLMAAERSSPPRNRLPWERPRKPSRPRTSSRISSTPRSDRFLRWPMCAAMEARPFGPRRGIFKRRAQRIAKFLGTRAEKVVVHWLSPAAQFGRKTFGGDGAEADAVNSVLTNRQTGAGAVDLAGGSGLVRVFAGVVLLYRGWPLFNMVRLVAVHSAF